MRHVRFLVTQPSGPSVGLPALELPDGYLSLQNLRDTYTAATGYDGLILHDDGLTLGVTKDSYLIRLEALTGLPNGTRLEPLPLLRARAWQRPSWFSRTLAWLGATLGERITGLEQRSSSDLATVLQVTTPARAVYLKVSETGLEAALTAALAQSHLGLTPKVIAWDVDKKRLLTEDCGAHLADSANLQVWQKAIYKLAAFHQSASLQFQELGCPVHPFVDLAKRAERFLRDATTLRAWGLTAEHVIALQERLEPLGRAHQRIATLELHLTPTHGDAHPMNALSGCGGVWFDWSEASVAHPLLDIGWFLAWLSHPARATLPLRQARPNAAAELWQTYLSAADPGYPDIRLADAMSLALMHPILVYHERFDIWQGTVPGWRPQYVPYDLRSLLKLPL